MFGPDAAICSYCAQIFIGGIEVKDQTHSVNEGKSNFVTTLTDKDLRMENPVWSAIRSASAQRARD